MRHADDSGPLAILGSGPLAREFALWAFDAGIDDVVFVNDIDGPQPAQRLAGRLIRVLDGWGRPHRFILGVGKTANKQAMVAKALDAGWTPAPSIAHPSAIIRSPLGYGGLVGPNCVITCDVAMGDFVTINLNCTVGHDSVLSEYVTLNPGAHVSGNVNLGPCVEIGTGAVIRDHVSICGRVIVGAGGAVVKDITEPGIYAGVPCARLK